MNSNDDITNANMCYYYSFQGFHLFFYSFAVSPLLYYSHIHNAVLAVIPIGERKRLTYFHSSKP